MFVYIFNNPKIYLTLRWHKALARSSGESQVACPDTLGP